MKKLPLGLKFLFSVNVAAAVLLLFLCLLSIYGTFLDAETGAFGVRLGLGLCSLVFIGIFTGIFFLAAKDIHQLKKKVTRNQGGINFLVTLVAIGALGLATFAKQSQIARQGFYDIGVQNAYYFIIACLFVFIIWSFVYLNLARIKRILVN